MSSLNWIGVVICLMHSAVFSGLNLGFFGVSRLRLEIQADTGNADAKRILGLRKDAHFLLATILWGNVSSNVLLTLLTDSVMAGVSAFLFSTVGITFFGEIIPQAFMAKNALRASIVLVPIIKFYQTVLYVVAKPTALLLDFWLGKEEILYFREDEIMIMLKRHSQADLSDLTRLESLGAMNFLALDDVRIEDEGEIIDPKSIIMLPTAESGLPIFPDFQKTPDDPFLQQLHASGKKWVIVVDDKKQPTSVIHADHFLRDIIYGKEIRSLYTYCHRPIVINKPGTLLGEVLLRLKVRAENAEDDVVDDDLILYWGKQKRIITGADILGRLLRGIVKRIQENP